MEGVHFASPLSEVKAREGKVIFDQAKHQTVEELFRTFSNLCSQSTKSVNKKDVTFVQNMADGPVEVSAKTVDVKHVQHQAVEILKRLEIKEGTLEQNLLQEIHTFSDVRKWQPGAVLSTVVAIVVAYLTMGQGTAAFGQSFAAALGATPGAVGATASAIVAGIGEGALIALTSSAALALLGCNGDLREAFKTLFSANNIKSMIIQAIAHGIMKGTIQHFDLPKLPLQRNFFHNCAVYGAKAAGYVGAKAIFYGRDAFRDLHKEAAQVVIQSLCADICKDIGKAYKTIDEAGKVIDGKLDYLSHKLMHAFVGAMGQAVKGPEAMAAGAAGGALGEILGEMFLNNKEMLEKITALRNQGKTEAEILKEHVDVKAFLVKLSAGLAIGMFGGDMQAAHDAADCAIENNSLKLLMGALAAGYVYVTGEELVNAHKRGGFDEVLRVIKSEAEVVFITEATAAELGGMPGAVLAAGGYMVYRIGGKLYPTAQKAWGALIKAQPALDHRNIQKGFANWCKGKGVKNVDLSGLKPQVKPGGVNSRIRGMLPHIEQARKLPGTAHVSGVLEELPQMLRGTHNNVGLIPKEVGDMLQGKQFRNFDDFRGHFWEAVGKTKYAQEFGEMNLSRITNGKAPIVSPEQRLGKRVHYEVHHKTPVVQDGAVFDLSNMILVTPRYHQEILAKGYHYGVRK